MLWILVGVNFNPSHGVMDSRNLNIFRASFFEPILKNAELTSSFELFYKLLHGNIGSDCF